MKLWYRLLWCIGVSLCLALHAAQEGSTRTISKTKKISKKKAPAQKTTKKKKKTGNKKRVKKTKRVAQVKKKVKKPSKKTKKSSKKSGLIKAQRAATPLHEHQQVHPARQQQEQQAQEERRVQQEQKRQKHVHVLPTETDEERVARKQREFLEMRRQQAEGMQGGEFARESILKKSDQHEPPVVGVPQHVVDEWFSQTRSGGSDDSLRSFLQKLHTYPQLLEARRENGRTALLLAAQKGSMNFVRELLQKKANVNTRDARGMTALMLVAENVKTSDLVPLLSLLLTQGADINAQDNEGTTACIYVVTNRNPYQKQALQFLLEHGARLDVPSVEEVRKELRSGNVTTEIRNMVNEYMKKYGDKSQ